MATPEIMIKIHTKSAEVMGVIEFDSEEPKYSRTIWAREKLEQEGVRESLFNDIVNILHKQGENFFHSGVASVDVYQRNEDGLRLDYWCDASGNGKIEFGLQAPHGKIAYDPVLVFTFNITPYTPQPWNIDLAQKVKESYKIAHYVPGDWERRLKERASN